MFDEIEGSSLELVEHTFGPYSAFYIETEGEIEVVCPREHDPIHASDFQDLLDWMIHDLKVSIVREEDFTLPGEDDIYITRYYVEPREGR